MQPPEPGFTRIFNQETGGTADVPDTSLPQHYRAGWAPLDESPEPEPEVTPEPVRVPRGKKAQDGQDGTKAQAGADDSAGSDDSTGKEK